MADILIIEDSSATGAAESSLLSRAGHQCRLVDSGSEGRRMIADRRPDLIILDHKLPDMDGIDLIESILRDDPKALIVVATGKGDEKLAAEAIKAGAKDYLPKNEQFLDILAHVVNRVLLSDKIHRDLAERDHRNKRLQAQNELSYWVAHNFRNLFSGAIGFLQLLDREGEEQARPERVYLRDQAMLCLAKANQLVDHLISLTELAGRPRQKVSLEKLIGKSLKKAVALLEEDGLPIPDFTFDTRIRDINILELSVQDFELVMTNLIRNALESLNESGKLTVAAMVVGGNLLVVKVRDNGRGMDEATMNQAMVPMFSTKGTVGAGLGLNLADAALRRNGGELKLSSAPNQGTTITITLPLTRSPKQIN